MNTKPNYITPSGYEALRERYHELFNIERPKVVDIVSWAAGNGDRSENGDYIYGKKRLREIDREVRWLNKRIKSAQVVEPSEQPDKGRIYFGATAELADEDDNRCTITLIGDDEAEPDKGHIGWNSPLARSLRRAQVGDIRTVRLPSGPKEWEIMAISY
ncbi:transcription elongation factor GreB [Sphingorhabdus sp. Alg239-R122]|uniref:transcription elongation factor GreB n=1 Tax=Sphingorhabdus sp. Alg239-R122 TaxID=2305989 RepID=UPI0013DD0BE0|nr:transcription elongation factor GreB [Sphingorhabdus sp. Alg239-R122]